MKITFLLPCKAKNPSGGFKVIFEYANRLCRDGHDVTIMMPAILYTLRNRLAGFIRYPYYLLTKDYLPYKWFDLDKRIICLYKWSLTEKNSPKSDIFIATSVETSFYLSQYTQDCLKYYLIQDFEAWDMSPEKVMDSYRLPLHKIAIAPWLIDKIIEAGSNAVLIPNGFDFQYFTLNQPIVERNKFSVLMLYHTDERKRCIDSINALSLVKKVYPQLEITMFGVPPRPSLNINFEFNYFQKPNRTLHNDIYNNASIFIAASKAEGMALPPAEAMQCGCALCCTDIGGFALYAKHEDTALISQVYDVESLSRNIIRLIENDQLRHHIARQGYEFIQKFTWDKAYSIFTKTIFQH